MDTGVIRAAKDIAAGTVGGIAICLVGHPFDTLKVRLQTQPTGSAAVYSGLSDCFKQTIKEEGIGGLYKGVGSPLVGQMFFRACMFLSYGQSVHLIQTYLTSAKPMETKWYFLAGAMTGTISAFIESPIDFFKSQVQVEIIKTKKTGIPPQYRNVFHCANQIIKERGILGAYQGFSGTLMRNIPACASFFGFNELTRRLLAGERSVTELETSELLFAGGVGGFLYWSTTYPLDVIKSALMGDQIHPNKRKYNGIIHCAQLLYQEQGWKRFTKGLAPCLMRSVPANAIMWTVFEKTRSLLK